MCNKSLWFKRVDLMLNQPLDLRIDNDTRKRYEDLAVVRVYNAQIACSYVATIGKLLDAIASNIINNDPSTDGVSIKKCKEDVELRRKNLLANHIEDEKREVGGLSFLIAIRQARWYAAHSLSKLMQYHGLNKRHLTDAITSKVEQFGKSELSQKLISKTMLLLEDLPG